MLARWPINQRYISQAHSIYFSVPSIDPSNAWFTQRTHTGAVTASAGYVARSRRTSPSSLTWFSPHEYPLHIVKHRHRSQRHLLYSDPLLSDQFRPSQQFDLHHLLRPLQPLQMVVLLLDCTLWPRCAAMSRLTSGVTSARCSSS